MVSLSRDKYMLEKEVFYVELMYLPCACGLRGSLRHPPPSGPAERQSHPVVGEIPTMAGSSHTPASGHSKSYLLVGERVKLCLETAALKSVNIKPSSAPDFQTLNLVILHIPVYLCDTFSINSLSFFRISLGILISSPSPHKNNLHNGEAYHVPLLLSAPTNTTCHRRLQLPSPRGPRPSQSISSSTRRARSWPSTSGLMPMARLDQSPE